MPRLTRLAVLGLCLALAGCARIDESLNRFGRAWDASPKTITLYTLNGTPVKTYDIGRSKVSRADGDGDYIFFYGNGHYVQTNMPYVVEGR